MLLSCSALAIWNDIADGADSLFDDWHVNEHMPERLAVPGFLRGRRYVRPSGGRYFTLYETRDANVLTSPEYLARLNDPTPWSSEIVPLVTSRRRTALDVAVSIGHGIGGALATLELGPAPGASAALRAWLDQATLPHALARPGIVAAHWGESDVGRSKLNTVEERLMDRPDDVARWVIMLEGISASQVSEAASEAAGDVERHGALPDHAAETFILTNLLEADR